MSVLRLDLGFCCKISFLLETCAARGVGYRIVMGDIGLAAQARLFCQGRKAKALRGRVAVLRSWNAPMLALLLEETGTLPGSIITDSLPGYSWHNWGLAVDLEGPEYATLRVVAREQGLTTGRDWGAPGHVQARPYSAGAGLTPRLIEAEMRKIHGAYPLCPS